MTFYPWWKRKKQDFKNLFWDYDKIPEESLEVLRGYYDSRCGERGLACVILESELLRSGRAWPCMAGDVHQFLAGRSLVGGSCCPPLSCRVSGGQPMSMYPPGRLIFVRPIKTRRKKAWDCVWISPEDIIGKTGGRSVLPDATLNRKGLHPTSAMFSS